MPAPLNPAPAITYLRENWIYVPTIAVKTAPTVIEVTAASALDMTLINFEGFGLPTKSTNRVTGQRRWGSGTLPERRGTTTYAGGTITAAMAPQAAAASDGKKAWEKFLLGVSGFFLYRGDLPQATNLIAGQFVDVWPIATDAAMPTRSGEGESSEAAFMFDYFITDTPAFNVALA